MGQFSWLDCVNKEQIIDDYPKDVFVLVPKEFRSEFGPRIREGYYNGYGDFGGYDIYDLVADWNREFLSNNPDFELPKRKTKIKEESWYKYYSDLNLSRKEVEEKMGDNWEWRYIGIHLACWDEDNAKIKYPIKITYNKSAIYEECDPSLSDPNQGWPVENDEEY